MNAYYVSTIAHLDKTKQTIGVDWLNQPLAYPGVIFLSQVQQETLTSVLIW